VERTPNDLAEDVGAEAPFRPTQLQLVAKQRVYRWLDERRGLFSLERLTRDQLIEAAGTKHIMRWLDDPQFVSWILEKEALASQLMAFREEAFAVLRGLALDGTGATDVRARLKAIELGLNLSGAFPSKTKEVRFVDKDLDAMPEHEVDRQLADARKKLKVLE
jgi:hypothetical protein